MLYGTVKGLDKKVSRLVQGTIMLKEDDLESGFELLDAAVAGGINTFDTGASYGGGAPDRVLGHWFEARHNREEVVVLGKAAHHSGDRKRVTPFDITADLFDSLARHKGSYIDLFLLHRDDPDVEVGRIVDILNEHAAAGRIRAFGGSNWTSSRIDEANEYADKHRLVPFVVSSSNLSLAVRHVEPWPGCLTITGDGGAVERAWYERTQMPLFSWSSLAGGFLSGQITRDNYESKAETMPLAYDAYCCYEPNFERLDRLGELADEKGAAIPHLALAWLLRQPIDAFALIGSLTPAELSDNIAALDVALTDAEAAWLNLETEER